MRRVTENELRERLWAQITVLKPSIKRAIGCMAEPERQRVVDHLMERLFTGVVVLEPSPVDPHRPRRFGVTEPWPLSASG